MQLSCTWKCSLQDSIRLWCWWSYFRGRSRDADAENGRVATGVGRGDDLGESGWRVRTTRCKQTAGGKSQSSSIGVQWRWKPSVVSDSLWPRGLSSPWNSSGQNTGVGSLSLLQEISCPTLGDRMNHSTPGLPVHHQLPEPTQTHVHSVDDAIQSSHPLSSPSPAAFNLSQHQGLFKWVSSSNQVAKVLELQLQHQSSQWTPRTEFL